jgi:hypothetical protein
MAFEAQGGPVESERENRPARSPYVAPELKVYGSVAAITQVIGMKGTVADGGSNLGHTKTS